nr:hypothetical protein [Novosphingobium panipatense]
MKQSRLGMALTVMAVLAAMPLFSPKLLAFPYRQQVGLHRVYSTQEISPALVNALHEADRRVAGSSGGGFRKPDQAVYLTDGGWRWKWLSLPSGGAFALTRPVTDTIVVNRLAGDKVYNGRSLGGVRGLAGVVAHEMTHGSIRAHFGFFADPLYPAMLREGYCDFVAGESTLSDAEARKLLAERASHPGLLYWQGHKRVAQAMAKPGADLDTVFRDWERN